MTIYGEYLFIQNYIITFLLLILTASLTGYMSKHIRLCIGSLWGAACSFVILLKMTPALSVVVRVVVGFICILITFGRKDLLKTTALYYVLTFCSGGMVLAISMWIQRPVISHQGIIYMETFTYLKVLCLGVLAFGFTYWFIKFIRKANVGTAVRGRVTLVMEGHTYFLKGFVDSGNSLKDPFLHRPVIIIDQKGAKKLHFFPKKFPEKFGLIPYKAVGTDYGLLESVRIDKIIFEKKTIEGIYLACYEGDFGDYEVLMSRDFLEGGLLEKIN